VGLQVLAVPFVLIAWWRLVGLGPGRCRPWIKLGYPPPSALAGLAGQL
jgi:hypothetical protein